ncbi:MAG TPA: DUF2079 domain-containing protein [Chloroflexia bacterium]|nr:DUF2079 domain-containing protein [Chloroflexia bacterium]
MSASSTARAQTKLGPLPGLAARLEAMAPRLLVLLVILWIFVVFAGSFYKYETFGQGYDQVDFEQAIWNTAQGRPMEDSRFNFTGSVFGMDWMPMLLFFVPFYALLPSAHTLFFLQIVGAALGAVPVYWLARDRLESRLLGLCAAALYLLFPTLLHTALNPFQLRLFSVTLLLFAFYFFERGRWALFAAFCLLAMLARTDVSLVVAMFGIYGLITRRRWPYVVVPLVAGLANFALATFVIVPSFAYPGALSGPQGEVGMSCWPCGTNPMLAYYGHLGSSGPEIIKYIVTHPIDVAGLMLQEPKLIYMASLLVPLLFLPLLAPRPLVLGLPILGLNLLSLREAQFDYEHHYSLLLIPGLIVAAIYGAARFKRWFESRSSVDEDRTRAGFRWASVGGLTAVIWALLMQVPYKNPVARAFLYPEPPPRVAAARELIGMVPAEAKVAASSKLAPRLLPRRYIYNFPPAPYSPYNFGEVARPQYVDLDFILVDPRASALPYEANKIGGKTGFELLQTLPQWHQVASREGLLLYQRR